MWKLEGIELPLFNAAPFIYHLRQLSPLLQVPSNEHECAQLPHCSASEAFCIAEFHTALPCYGLSHQIQASFSPVPYCDLGTGYLFVACLCTTSVCLQQLQPYLRAQVNLVACNRSYGLICTVCGTGSDTSLQIFHLVSHILAQGKLIPKWHRFPMMSQLCCGTRRHTSISPRSK